MVDGTRRPCRFPEVIHQYSVSRCQSKYFKRTCSQATDNPRSANAGVHNGNNISELALECGIEISAALDCSQAVAVCQFGEDADVAVILELKT